jgi:hypothetical protein
MDVAPLSFHTLLTSWILRSLINRGRRKGMMLRKALCFSLWMGAASIAHASPSYSVQVLGAEANFGDLALNDAGQVAANKWIFDLDVMPAPFSTGVLFENGSTLELTAPGGGNFHAAGVTAHGAVIGNTGALMAGHRPVVWQNGSAHFVDLPTGSVSGWVWSGNSLGDMVGFATLESGARVSVLWGRDGAATILAPSGDYAGFTAYGISESGVVVGVAASLSTVGEEVVTDERIVLWREGSFEDLGSRVHDIDPRRINAVGQIIGSGAADDESDNSAGYWIDAEGTVHLLSMSGAESTAVEAINDAGWMVGSAWTEDESFAVLWRDGEGVDLNDLIDPSSGLTIIDARAINNARQIAALAVDAEGATRVVLLTPVPEPHSWALLLGGALVLFRRVRHKVRAA